MTGHKIILVIGATGAQGLAVVDALLSPQADGKPNAYSVRALTRDPSSKRAMELQTKGVELVRGTYTCRETMTLLNRYCLRLDR